MEIFLYFLPFSIISVFLISNTTSSAIHRELEFLISKENSQYYGISPSKDEYEIIHVENNVSSRRRLESTFNDRTMKVSFKAFGEYYRIHLKKSNIIIPEGLRMEYVNENGNVIKTKEVPRGCHYTGSAVSHAVNENALSTISLCNGISGVVSTRNHTLHIQPLRKDHSNEYKNKLGHNDRQYHPHLVYRRNAVNHQDDPGYTDYFCGGDPNPRLTNENATLTPNTTLSSTGSGNKLRRNRRQAMPKYLEVIVTIDRDMANFHGDNVEYYAMDFVNVAAARFQEGRLSDTQLFFSVVKIIVLQSDTIILNNDTVNEQGSTFNITSDGEDTLKNFCSYQFQLNPSDVSADNHWDLAILLTRKDLELKDRPLLVGLAKHEGLCKPSLQCLLCRDYGLSSGLVLAHEIGHTFGINHDGDLGAQSCQDGQYLMSTSRITIPGTFQWSQCSRSQFESFLSQYDCLNDVPAEQILQINNDLGCKSDANEQCRNYATSMNVACTEAELSGIGKTLADTCSNLHCIENDLCVATRVPSLDGTVCGINKVCKEGICEPEITIPPPTPIDGGWSAWSPNPTPCTRTCGGGTQLQHRTCTNPAPANGGSGCVGSNSRVRLCNDQPCPTSQQDFKNEQCEMAFGTGSIALTTNGNDDALCEMKCFNFLLGTTSTNGFYMDGTHCGGDYKVCVNGRCQRFGCDGIQNSNLENDQCGVCGGDGSSCFKEGYYFGEYIGVDVNVLTFARHTADIYVESTDPRKSIGLKVNGTSYIVDGKLQPVGTTTHFSYFDTSAVLYEKSSNAEIIRITGRTSVLFTLTVYVSEGVSEDSTVSTSAILYQYYGEPVTLLNNYKWIVEEGICHACATFVLNNVTCKWLEANIVVDSSFCNNEPRPPDQSLCPCTWFYQNYLPCNATCGTDSYRSRTAVCVNGTNPLRPVDSSYCPQSPHLHERCDVPACPMYEWLLGQWDQCSVTCGTGVQRRNVICRELTSSSQVNDLLCNQPKPITLLYCNLPPCRCDPIPCDPGNFFNTVTCSCQACVQTVCRSGRRYNAVLCQCEDCQQLDCASGFSYNPSTCQCEGCVPIPCEPGNFFNTVTCSCQACIPIACPTGRRYNAALCQCEDCPELNCARGFSYNPSTCQCEACVQTACPSGRRYNAVQCQCEDCPQLNCASGFSYNPSTCQCEACVPTVCATGRRYNPALCQCEDCPQLNCARGFSYNPSTCQCEGCVPVPCESGNFFNTVTCSCQACVAIVCPSGRRYNSEICQCEDCPQLNCASGFIYNPSTCQCEGCVPVPCESGNFFNTVTCSCQACFQIVCASGRRYNSEICQCEDCPQLNCASGFIYNPSTCQCEGCHPIPCDPGNFFNTVTCSCQACVQTVCTSGRRYNAVSCQCEDCPQLNCAAGFSYNPSTCQCEGCEPFPCEPGNFFNTVTCSCQACVQTVCASGRRYNPVSCQCEACVEHSCTLGSTFNQDTCQCESDLQCGQLVQGNPFTAREGSLIQFLPVKGQLCSVALLSPVGYFIELTLEFVFVGGQDEKFEVTDGGNIYTWHNSLYDVTLLSESNLLLIDLLATEDGHGYYITYKLMEDSGR